MEKQRWEEEENQRRERVRRKKMQAHEKSRKVAKHCALSFSNVLGLRRVEK